MTSRCFSPRWSSLCWIQSSSRQADAVVDGGRGGSAMVVDKSVLPKVARRGRQRRKADQAMAAAAGWPASLLAMTLDKDITLAVILDDTLFYGSFLSRPKTGYPKKYIDSSSRYGLQNFLYQAYELRVRPQICDLLADGKK